MKECRVCKISKDESEFSSNKSKSSGINDECKECQKDYFREYYKKNKQKHIDRVVKVNLSKKQKLWLLKLELGCNRCGYNKHPAALHFHHINPEDKIFAISEAHSHAWEVIQAEIEKCECICANCHAIEHSNVDLDNLSILKETKSRPNKRSKKYSKFLCNCGNRKGRLSSKCVTCAKLESSSTSKKPNIEILLQFLRETNYCAVGRMFNVTDNTVRKWIKSYGYDCKTLEKL